MTYSSLTPAHSSLSPSRRQLATRLFTSSVALSLAALGALAGCSEPPGGASSGAGGVSGAAGSAAGGAAGSAAGGAAGGVGGAAGVSGAGGTGGLACDPLGAPEDNPCAAHEDYAIFVSPDGSPSAPGTRAAPLSSINLGLLRAQEGGKRLFVCASGGSYDEQVVLTEAHHGVAAWGSFDCADWSHSDSLRARVAPSDERPALRASQITEATQLTSFEFIASSASTAGGSSVAAFVRDSTALVLAQVHLEAGAGQPGRSGVTTPFTYETPIHGNPGASNTGGAGGAQRVNACAMGGSSVGGKGGDGSNNPGSPGTPALTSPDVNGGQAGVSSACNTPPLRGRAGNPGPKGDDGVGAPRGAVSAAGWVPGLAGDGTHGATGQGGGGGYGISMGAGGGGAGGCGGAQGKAGESGGVSVALMLFQAPIQLINVSLVSGNAGAGGHGSAGQEGQAGGLGARPGSSAACVSGNGGDGGPGGDGGGGGGGAGGISAGVLYVGDAPLRAGGTIQMGAAGATGTGGGSTNGGAAGVAQELLELTP